MPNDKNVLPFPTTHNEINLNYPILDEATMLKKLTAQEVARALRNGPEAKVIYLPIAPPQKTEMEQWKNFVDKTEPVTNT